MRRSLLAGLLALAACSVSNSNAGGGAASGGRPRIVALIVIDQLPSWVFAEREALFTHGLARLLKEGTVYPQVRYPYAATFTGPGHAALATGAPPSVTGIVSNEWWERAERTYVESVTDEGYPMLVVGGWPGELATGRPRAAPTRMRVLGLADALHAGTSGKGKAVGVSLKNRAAILALGRGADLAAWYDEGQRAFTTSAWYARTAPPWLIALARDHAIGPRLAEPWVPLDAARLARATTIPDDAPGEAINTTFGAAFPHLPLALGDPSSAIKLSPLGATVVTEAALAAAAAEHLGEDDTPDLLVVSYSSYDYVGHAYGQESWEAIDTLLRLDREIGDLVAGLEARAGAGRVAVLVTSDHGGPRMPERNLGDHPVRVEIADVRAAVERAVEPIAGRGPWLEAWREPSLWFDPRFRRLPADVRERALDAAAEAARGVEGIGWAVRTDKLSPRVQDCDARPPADAMLCRSIDPERSGDLLFFPRRGSLIRDKEGDSIAHGSPTDEDTTVPAVLWGPGIAAGRHEALVSALQIAPTLARLLGVPPPAAATAPPLAY
jgi:predicted AlkP superfamily pyrophosphatase or phosphodiesterase